MYVHGASTFDVVATPAPQRSNDNTMVYNGMASFEKDGHIHEYSLVDGTTYYTSRPNGSPVPEAAAGCLPAGSVPPIGSVLNAIHSATTAQSGGANSKCPGGSVMVFQFAGEDFVLCSSQSVQDGFQIYGKHLDIGVNDCSAVSDGSVALSSLGQLYGITMPSSLRALKEESEAVHLASSTCTCQSTPRPCLFFHGMDVKADGGIVDSYSFFGDIKEHAPCCSSFSFAILNTVDYEWYNDTLQQKACNAAMSVSTGKTDSGSTEINDLIIVAHSMGNNMLAGALATGKCSIGSNVDWVDLSGPMKGSMGSDFLHQICDGGNVWQNILAELGGLIGQCPGTTTRRSLVYDGGNYCDSECSARYAAARAVHKKYVTASMCGTTYSGLLSGEYAGLLAGGLLIPHHSSKNDGIVEFQSCIGDLDSSLFKTTYSTTWYAAALNHADTTFHNGEGLFSSAKKPLKWFECLL
eukprot:jgi/Phyca11/573718/estExt2_Genewise1.C_PHYCAscaffold_550091